jgi:peptide chain release factor 2
VKDMRRRQPEHRPAEVLDGDTDDFIEVALAQRVKGGGPAQVEDTRFG